MTTLRPERLDELLACDETPQNLLGNDGLFRRLKTALPERALHAELSEQRGYDTGAPLIVVKAERQLNSFDDDIVSIYARGMTMREIRGHLHGLKPGTWGRRAIVATAGALRQPGAGTGGTPWLGQVRQTAPRHGAGHAALAGYVRIFV